jgi:hypothetical protein
MAPRFQLFNIFHVNDRLTTHNIDGTGAKLPLQTLYVVVRSETYTGDVIGCTAAKLA